MSMRAVNRQPGYRPGRLVEQSVSQGAVHVSTETYLSKEKNRTDPPMPPTGKKK